MTIDYILVLKAIIFIEIGVFSFGKGGNQFFIVPDLGFSKYVSGGILLIDFLAQNKDSLINIQKYTGHPFAFQTVGSSMAVRSDIYQKQGGMNKRKAGEDFYFIQKFIQLGHFTELTTTKVIPSPRISHRVPFGTGRSITQQIANQNQKLTTYNPLIFENLKSFFENIEKLYQLESNKISIFVQQQNTPTQQFLATLPFEKKVIEIQKNTTTLKRFKHRFFLWFNAFMLMKYTHFLRDNFYQNIPITAAVIWLSQRYYQEQKEQHSAKEILQWIRLKDRKLV